MLKPISTRHFSSLFHHIALSIAVRVILDQELAFSPHINLVARKCYYQLCQLRVISHSLTHQSTPTLVHAFVTSHIDCCCSLLAGLPLDTLARLDGVLLHLDACLLSGGCPSSLPSLLCTMYNIGCLSFTGYSIQVTYDKFLSLHVFLHPVVDII